MESIFNRPTHEHFRSKITFPLAVSFNNQAVVISMVTASQISVLIVENSSSQLYFANGLIIVISTFLLRSCYYFLIKLIQSFVSHYSTDYEYSIMLSLLLSLLHVVVVIYNSSVIKKSLSVITLFYNIKFICDSIITRHILKILSL